MKLQHWILDEQHKVIRADLMTWAARVEEALGIKDGAKTARS